MNPYNVSVEPINKIEQKQNKALTPTCHAKITNHGSFILEHTLNYYKCNYRN